MDVLILSTGFRPDRSILGELHLSLDPALDCTPAPAPLIDPNLHSCGTVRPHGAAELSHPEPGFHIAGMKSYGRAPTFLLATGHEQIRSSWRQSQAIMWRRRGWNWCCPTPGTAMGRVWRKLRQHRGAGAVLCLAPGGFLLHGRRGCERQWPRRMRL